MMKNSPENINNLPESQLKYQRDTEAFRVAIQHSNRVKIVRHILPWMGSALIVIFLGMAFLPNINVLGFNFNMASLSQEGLMMDNPRLTGFVKHNRAYELKALHAIQTFENPNIIKLEKIDASVETDHNGWVQIDAGNGIYDNNNEQLVLLNGVIATSSDGYKAQLKQAKVDFTSGMLVSDQPVKVFSQNISVKSDAVAIHDNGKKIRFHGNVRMILNQDDKISGRE